MAPSTENPHRVLIFDSYYATLGGNQRYIAMLLRARGWGWRAALCCPGEGPLTAEARNMGAEVHVLPQPPRLDRGRSTLGGAGMMDKLLTAAAILAYNFRLVRVLRVARPDIIQCHSTRNVMMAGLAALIARVPLVLFIKGEMTSPIADRIALWLSRTTIFLTPHLKPRFCRAGSANAPVRFPTLRIGIHMHEVDDAERRIETVLPPGVIRDGRTTTFAFAGWLTETKGVHRLIEAFADVHRQHPRTRLLIAGESNDAAYRKRLEDMVTEAGLTSDVMFLGWRNDILDILAAADVYVLPSFTEGVPRSIVETMAMGKPVVATSVGGIPELLGNGEFGLLCPPDDAPALAGSMKRLAADRDLAIRLGVAARTEARARYSFEAHLDGLSEILTNSLKNHEKSDSSSKVAANF